MVNIDTTDLDLWIMRTLHHLAIKSQAPESLARFYFELFELPEIERHTDARGLRSVWLQLGEMILMVERSGSHSLHEVSFQDDPPGLHLIALKIEPEEASIWRARLESAGVKIESQSRFTLYFADPEGNRLGLSSWPEPLKTS